MMNGYLTSYALLGSHTIKLAALCGVGGYGVKNTPSFDHHSYVYKK